MFFTNFFGKHRKEKVSSTKHLSTVYLSEPEFMRYYRNELRNYSLSIESFNTIVKYNGGLIKILKEYVLMEVGIGDGTRMCSMTFPNIFEESEKNVDPDYFENGVRFTLTIDNWAQVISNQEFVWLIEDTCKIHLVNNPDDAVEIQELMDKIRKKFNK